MTIYSIAESEVQEDSVITEALVATSAKDAYDLALGFMTRCILDFYGIDPLDSKGLDENMKRMAVNDEIDQRNGLSCRRYVYEDSNFVLSATVQEVNIETETKGDN